MENLTLIFGIIFGFMTAVWIVSLILKDASIVDQVWGLLFVLLAWLYASFSDALHGREALLLGLVTIWGLRLSVHIHIRNRGQGEDVRYQRMRKERGASFWWYSWFSVFALQGTLALLISAPLYVVFLLPASNSFQWSDALGVVLWVAGFIFEAGGDWQLRKFKADPGNKGKLLDTGLWSLTRHPNYFGDACLWWGYYCFALSISYGWVSFFGPLIMTFFLRYVSGVTLLEKDLKNTKPGYEDYLKNTPAFFPRLWPKKKEQ